jgi:hypothetical protein
MQPKAGLTDYLQLYTAKASSITLLLSDILGHLDIKKQASHSCVIA